MVTPVCQRAGGSEPSRSPWRIYSKTPRWTLSGRAGSLDLVEGGEEADPARRGGVHRGLERAARFKRDRR
eukprot:3943215-Pyramimonas_sp.AAC.1